MSDDTTMGSLEASLEFAKMAAEPLHPDLESYVHDSEYFGKVLKHPFVIQVPFSIPGLANRSYEHKRKGVERALANKDWHSYIWLHERPYRFEALEGLSHAEESADISDDDWHSLVRDVWIDSENVWQHLDEWVELLKSTDRDILLTDEEKARLAALPETVTIYRGATLELNEEGLSWTLDHDRAVWFAKRLAQDDDERVVIVAEVQRDDILALFESRSEDEVVVMPEDVHIKHYEEI